MLLSGSTLFSLQEVSLPTQERPAERRTKEPTQFSFGAWLVQHKVAVGASLSAVTFGAFVLVLWRSGLWRSVLLQGQQKKGGEAIISGAGKPALPPVVAVNSVGTPVASSFNTPQRKHPAEQDVLSSASTAVSTEQSPHQELSPVVFNSDGGDLDDFSQLTPRSRELAESFRKLTLQVQALRLQLEQELPASSVDSSSSALLD